MEDEANLVGKGGTATGAIGRELRLVQLDQIFRLPARAVEAVVDPLCCAEPIPRLVTT